MTQLENLLRLEKNQDLMDKLNEQLSELQEARQLKGEEAKYEEVSSKLSKMEESLNTGKTKLRKSDLVLKEYELKIKDLDEELYSGSISNEKQLLHLTKEKDKIKELLGDLETEILENMDAISDLEDEIDQIKSKLLEFKKYIDIKKKEIKENIVKLEEAKAKLNDNISKLISLIDDNLVANYRKIRDSKGTALALVEGGICSGCNIMVPNYLIEDIKKGSKLVHCESCNRILHIAKDNIEK